ncbi:phosphatase PAP2 family protein [Sphingomonas rosea]|uniref:Phosphatase PAP2 family protein n=1 Tax=Sphingomonas rosea TaxID=335605 RepID=A0ABP7U2W7_9SPHN
MRRFLLATTAATMVLTATPAEASKRGWERASNISRTIVVGASLALPAYHGDWRGLGGTALALGLTGAATAGLKYAIPETRPDGSDNKSFPSGHTSLSFAAAASLHKRYGWQAGLPAYALASFTGLARVKADKHYVQDVVAGAALGTAGGWLLNSRRNDRVEWLPWADRHGAGLALTTRF